MKKVYSFLCIVALAALTLLTSCEKEDTSFLVGEWKLETASVMDLSPMSVDDISKSVFGKYVPYINNATAILNSDKTFSAVLPMDGVTKTGTWSYNKDGGKIQFQSGKTTIDAKYADGVISVPYEIDIAMTTVYITGNYKKK